MHMENWETEFLRVLHRHYREFAVKSGKRAAVRSYSKFIGMAPGSVSQLLTGRRNWRLTKERAKEILPKLELGESELNHILSLMGEPGHWKNQSLRDEDFPLLTNWIYPAILFCFDLSSDEKNFERIGRRLNIDVKKVEETVEDLLRRGFLERRAGGEIFRKEGFLKSSDDIPSAAVKESHLVNLEVAAKALKSVPVAERDFTALTFVGSPARIALLKAEIRKLYDAAVGLTCTDDVGEREVLRLSVNLFPLNFSQRPGDGI